MYQKQQRAITSGMHGYGSCEYTSPHLDLSTNEV